MLDCIIVGAGFSGLAAAQRLHEERRSFLILEARDRVGGRTESGTLAGATIDLGGMWLGASQPHLAALAQAFQVQTYPTWLNGTAKVKIGGLTADVEGEFVADALSAIGASEMSDVFRRINALSENLDTATPWKHPDADKLDGMTVATWIDAAISDQALHDLFVLFCQSLFCAEPAQISMLFFLVYVKSAGGLDVLITAGDGGAQNFLFEGGVHQIAQKMANAFSDRLAPSTAVVAVEQDGAIVTVRTQHDVHVARRLIIAVPPGLVSQIQFKPDLPHTKHGLLQRQPMGACIKVWIAYQKPFWRDPGANGFTLEKDVPFTPMFDTTPPGSTAGMLAGFFDARAAVKASQWSPAERQREVVATLVRLFGPEAATPIGYLERDWTAERWSQGCYGAYMGPGTMTTYGHALRAPFGLVHWAGTETAVHWSGYIEGAIESGRRAADEVIAAWDRA